MSKHLLLTSKLSVGILAVVFIVALLIGISFIALTKASDPLDTSAANLWVNTTSGSSSSRCSPQCSFSSTNAYGSLQAALAASSPGDIIRVKAGTYAAQSVSAVKSSPGVTVIGEANTSFANLSVTGSWVEIQNITVNSGLSIQNTPSGMPNNITFKNVIWNGGWWLSNCCDNIKQTGGRIHDVTAANEPTAIMIEGLTASTPTSNITLEGVEIDHMSHSVSGSHFEAVRIQGWVNNAVIRNSWFHDNGVNSSQIFISSFTGGTSHTPGPLTIEGNKFEPPLSSAGDAPAFFDINGNMQGLPCPDLTIRNNTNKSSLIGGGGQANFLNCTSPSSVKITANITPRYSKYCDGTYSYNILIGANNLNCGTGDRTVASSSEAGLTGDGFHITNSSPALDAGGMVCPSTDFDGDLRPQGAACDVGADEIGVSSSTNSKNGDINNDGSVNIFDLSILLSHFNSSDSGSDLNSDGSVNIFDLSILLSHFGQ